MSPIVTYHVYDDGTARVYSAGAMVGEYHVADQGLLDLVIGSLADHIQAQPWAKGQSYDWCWRFAAQCVAREAGLRMQRSA